MPYIKKLQAAAAQYFKRGDKRTSIDVSPAPPCCCLVVSNESPSLPLLLQVIEYYGELNQQYRNFLFYDLFQIEQGLAK